MRRRRRRAQVGAGPSLKGLGWRHMYRVTRTIFQRRRPCRCRPDQSWVLKNTGLPFQRPRRSCKRLRLGRALKNASRGMGGAGRRVLRAQRLAKDAQLLCMHSQDAMLEQEQQAEPGQGQAGRPAAARAPSGTPGRGRPVPARELLQLRRVAPRRRHCTPHQRDKACSGL